MEFGFLEPFDGRKDILQKIRLLALSQARFSEIVLFFV